MKLLLINAKPSLIDALAAAEGVAAVAVWPRKNSFGHLPPPSRAPLHHYRGGPKFSPRAAWQLRRLIRAERPDVVHAFYGRALAHAVMAVMGLRPRPRIVSFRGITSPLARRNVGDWLTYRHPFVDAHACESEAVRAALVCSGIAADLCAVTYNSMLHPPAGQPGRAALAEFDIPASAFVVGTVGTFRPVKGADLLLQAAAQCADLADVHWLLIGRVLDPQVRRLACDPRIRGRVRLVGQRPDASELISGADLFVMPSRAEALCQALLEAMHQGVCPVVSDAGGMKEVVRHNLDGVVVPSEDVAALAKAIRTLYADRARVAQYGAAAIRRIADAFSPAATAARTLALYRRVVAVHDNAPRPALPSGGIPRQFAEAG
jgi:glycosyltransferase involved in cell wall biosynthesis